MKYGIFSRASSLLTVLMIAPLSAGSALAQSNEVYLGQRGNTNTLSVVQDGRSNVIGGEAASLNLTQTGDQNEMTVNQQGEAHGVATTSRSSSRPSLGLVMTGLGQFGDFNRANISQTNTIGTGDGSVVEALRQQSSDSLSGTSGTANQLNVVQEGSHAISQIIQVNELANLADGAANLIDITQRGLLAANEILTVFQTGWGNQAKVLQLIGSQVLETIRQGGADNRVAAEQSNGQDNFIRAIDQIGDSSAAQILQSGSRNAISNIVQSTWANSKDGNTLTLTLAGDDNGGDGKGNVGAFKWLANNFGIDQGSVTQIGEGNQVSYTTTATSQSNLFGFFTGGSSNIVVGVADGKRNEAAVQQLGDNNVTLFVQLGDDNGLAARALGNRNSMNVTQSGQGNLASIDIAGDDNRVFGTTVGAGNSASVTQASNLDTSTFTQSGQANGVVISQ